VVARYPDSEVLASGWLVGEKAIAGRAAMIDAPMGSGHVVLFGMRPQYRPAFAVDSTVSNEPYCSRHSQTERLHHL
jgi:glutamine amidotransferase-like uncharacterized protein